MELVTRHVSLACTAGLSGWLRQQQESTSSPRSLVPTGGLRSEMVWCGDTRTRSRLTAAVPDGVVYCGVSGVELTRVRIPWS